MTIRIAPTITPAFAGSSSSTSAIATEKSGAVPTVTDVREGPASRTASVKRSCEPPGPSTPARRNGQIPARSTIAGRDERDVTSSAAAIVCNAPASASASCASAKRSATVIEPKSAAEQERARPRPRSNATATTIRRRGRPARSRAGRAARQPLPGRAAGLAGAGPGDAARPPARHARSRARSPAAGVLAACGSTGGRSASAPTSTGRSRRRSSCSRAARDRGYQVANEDARLTIRAPEDVYAGSQLDPERRRLLQRCRRARKPARPHARRSLGGRRVPDRGGGRRGGDDAGRVRGLRLRRLPAATGTPKRSACGEIDERFDRAGEVRIVGEETDLTLGIEGREGVVSARPPQHARRARSSTAPSRTRPRRDHLRASSRPIYLGHDVVGARLVFRKGRRRRGDGRRGRRVPAADPRHRRGRAPARRARHRLQPADHEVHMRNILFDEKIDGTVHLAVGASYTYTGGKNESAIHWDMVKDLRPGGELSVDGELVQRDGAWLDLAQDSVTWLRGRRRRAGAAFGRLRLGDDDAGHDQRAAAPSRRRRGGHPRARSRRCPRRPAPSRTRARSGSRSIRRCAHVWTRKPSALAKMPGDEQRAPDRPAARHLDLAERDGDERRSRRTRRASPPA